MPVGEHDKFERGFGPHHHRLDIHVRWHSAERGVESAPQPLPCGITPYLPQPGVRGLTPGEFATRRNPGVHGHQNRVAHSCFSRSTAQRLQATD